VTEFSSGHWPRPSAEDWQSHSSSPSTSRPRLNWRLRGFAAARAKPDESITPFRQDF
jgi:hypothetical protein